MTATTKHPLNKTPKTAQLKDIAHRHRLIKGTCGTCQYWDRELLYCARVGHFVATPMYACVFYKAKDVDTQETAAKEAATK